MKRGQTEVRQILLVFELIVVILIILVFYQTTHRETSLTAPELEQQLSDLAVKTAVGVENLRPVSPLPSEQKWRDLS